MAVTYIKMFADWLDAIEPLNDEERGRLFTALLQYVRTGEAPALQGNERFVFPVLRRQHDRDAAAYKNLCETNRANGAKSGRNRPQADASESSQEKEEEKDFSSCGADRPAQRKNFSKRRSRAIRRDSPEAARQDMERMEKFLQKLRQEAGEQAGEGDPDT